MPIKEIIKKVCCLYYIQKLRDWHIVIGIAILVAAVYGQTIAYSFVWDDHRLIENNPFVVEEQNISELWSSALSENSIWMYRPLVIHSFRLNMSITSKPWIFHLVNVMIHIVASLLVFLLARRLGASLIIAGFASIAFAVYSPNTEPVAWISGRADLMLGCGILIALIAIYPNRTMTDSNERLVTNNKIRQSILRAIFLAIGLFVALFSKEIAIPVVFALILVILMVDYKSRSEKITMLVTALMSLIVLILSRIYALNGLHLFSKVLTPVQSPHPKVLTPVRFLCKVLTPVRFLRFL
ncbi:MAG: hypothetical protein JXR91_17185 [Deltaproteobacteria bacterium]|nr:hypothetical protein [Deltaproteobacteria bacterium]